MKLKEFIFKHKHWFTIVVRAENYKKAEKIYSQFKK